MDADITAVWQELGWAARRRWLARFRAAVARDAQTLIGLITDETHKPADEALTGDILPLLAACRWLEQRGGGVLRDRALGGRPFWLLGQRALLRRAPLGTVGIIATWNYPVQLLGIQLVQALVAGNRVVVKPSEHSPRTHARLLDLALAAGLPPGTLDRTPATREAGRRLLDGTFGRLDHLVFTGSTGVGREVAAWGARTLTPTTLELSGHDSAIVLSDADPALAARTIWNAVVMNGGQTCLAPRRAIVSARAWPGLIDALAPLAAAARPRRLITAQAAAHCAALVADAQRLGARSLSGVVELPGPGSPWLRPLAMAECPADSPLAAGEHFGPVLALIPARDDRAALAIHAGFAQRLATSLFTRSARRGAELAAALGSSLVTINDAVIPAMHPASGISGIGPSGWGVSRGIDGLLAMTRPVTVTRTRPTLRLPPGPVSASSMRGLRQLVSRLYARGPALTLPAPPPAPAPEPHDTHGLHPPDQRHPAPGHITNARAHP